MTSKALLLIIFSLFAFSTAAEVDDPVLHLTHTNFSNITDGKDFIILFFSPYCHHCQRFKPQWQLFAKEVRGQIGVGDVDWYKPSKIRI